MTKNKDNWGTYSVRIGLNLVSHPLEYAKILIQIGHEPFPPRPAVSLFGRPTLKLPNIFEYVKHIKKVDGYSGWYRGLVPKLCGNMVSALASQKVVDYFEEDEVEENNEAADSRTEQEKEKERFVRTLRKDVVSHVTAIVISQPFHVITIRMMAQFVGSETRYTGIFASVVEIYRQNGVTGFFSGLIPRVLGDVLSLIFASTLAYIVNSYFLEDKELQMYTSASTSFIASTLTYPFQVVANCMAVSGSGLAAGSPPHMPVYTSWTNCWSHLSQTNNLKRGSSLLLRYYTGPQIVINGRAMPVNKEGFGYE